MAFVLKATNPTKKKKNKNSVLHPPGIKQFPAWWHRRCLRRSITRASNGTPVRAPVGIRHCASALRCRKLSNNKIVGKKHGFPGFGLSWFPIFKVENYVCFQKNLLSYWVKGLKRLLRLLSFRKGLKQAHVWKSLKIVTYAWLGFGHYFDAFWEANVHCYYLLWVRRKAAQREATDATESFTEKWH